MKYFKKLEGKTIYLSPMSLDDAETYTKWLNDFEVTNGLGNSSKIFTVEVENEWLETVLKKGEYSFAIVDLKTDILLGSCGFNKLDSCRQTGTVGIFIGEKENRGKGIGTEALSLLIEFGFDYLNLNNINLDVYSFNKGAVKCYEKVGFKKYGVRHEVYPLKGKLYDLISMEILKKDYREGK